MKAMSDEGFLILCDIAAIARDGDSTSRLHEYVCRGSAFLLGINWVSLTCAYCLYLHLLDRILPATRKVIQCRGNQTL